MVPLSEVDALSWRSEANVVVAEGYRFVQDPDGKTWIPQEVTDRLPRC
ncbi:hypothetical protein NIIDNTM18_05500 [Mycolicibacterium litorale]|uniref:Uncharacterized protein n=1 Tax=Mycolicibacterium litorale TaxID=758802 RepID=A0A6S6NZK1_9MYCO|nr:hypothetical protein NIIDNTM18_05500 [Mycolicibacterium litorale]